MQFTREINRVLLGILLILLVVAASATYWAVVGSDTILKRPDNPRQVEAEASIRRGSIFDRNGVLLVETVVNADDSITRQYLHPETYSALGYFSLRYGVGGAEAAYNTILRGDDLPRDLSAYLENELLHRPREGSDIRMTLDLAIQQELARLMTGYQGAAVVLSVPNSEVLAMLSLPTFDPNTLDSDWELLAEAPGNPFFNRALQGNYQPGGTLQTPLIAAAMLTGTPLDTQIENATRPIPVDDVEIRCAAVLPPRSLSLREAYTFSCPMPFAELAEQLGLESIHAIFDTFGLGDPVTLPDFTPELSIISTPSSDVLLFDSETMIENVLGQGLLTTTPLKMAMIAAAIVNDGNASQPYTLLGTRPPETETWIEAGHLYPQIPLMTANTARQLQDMMRLTVATGAAQNAGRPNIDIGGHATLAHSGEGTQAWFVGFATLGGRQGIAIAIVIENSEDPGLAADIGGSTLAIAAQQLVNQKP